MRRVGVNGGRRIRLLRTRVYNNDMFSHLAVFILGFFVGFMIAALLNASREIRREEEGGNRVPDLPDKQKGVFISPSKRHEGEDMLAGIPDEDEFDPTIPQKLI